VLGDLGDVGKRWRRKKYCNIPKVACSKGEALGSAGVKKLSKSVK